MFQLEMLREVVRLRRSRSGQPGDDDGGEWPGISRQELIYGASSYHAVVTPVSATMMLTALAVIYVNTESTRAAGEAALSSTYQVFAAVADDDAVQDLVPACVAGPRCVAWEM